MDPASKDKTPPKRQRSAAQQAVLANAIKKKNKKGTGAFSRHSRGKKQKLTSYNFAGVSASLDVTASNSQAIKLVVMPPVEPQPLIPTTKEYAATNNKQEKNL